MNLIRRTCLVTFATLVGLTVSAVASAEEVEVAPSTPAAPPVAPAPAALPTLPAPLEGGMAAPAPAPAPAPAAAQPVAPMASPLAGPCAESPEGCAAEKGTRSDGWYGYQTLITDSLAITLAFASVKLGPVAGFTSFGTYLFGAPIVHAVHGRLPMFAASLGTRLVTPVLGTATGLAIGAAVDSCKGGGDLFCGGPFVGAAIGALSGFAAAVVLDAAVYSRVPKEAKAPPARQAWDGKPTLAPTLAASPTGGTVGLGGVF